jgi:ADP-ribose pyrophosphatase YjhB (NUDIX family)
MAAAVLLVDDDDRVLIVRPTYRPGWDLPGGVVEQDEWACHDDCVSRRWTMIDLP